MTISSIIAMQFQSIDADITTWGGEVPSSEAGWGDEILGRGKGTVLVLYLGIEGANAAIQV